MSSKATAAALSSSEDARINFDEIIPREGSSSLKWERYRGEDILPFWVADMDFAAAPPIQRAIEERVAHRVFGYTVPPDDLAPALIAHLEREFGWRIEPEWIVWMPGVVTGLAVACRAYAAPGRDMLINTPIYFHFFDAHVEGVQRPPLEVPLQRVGDRWTFDFDALEARFSDDVDLLLLCSPHNPGGTVFTADELRQVVSLAARHDAVVLSDEIHAGLVFDRSARHVPTALAAGEHSGRVVTISSASKAWNIPGLNCAFAVIEDAALRERWLLASRSIVPGVPPLAYTATLAAYREGDAWRQQLLDYLRGNYTLIGDRLAGIEGVRLDPMQATYLAWIDVSALALDDARAAFEAHGLGFDEGDKFGKPGYIRWNFACPRARIEEGLQRFEMAVAALSNTGASS
ncbi:MAG: aspartate aminotransferase [Gammaproteobacteria bacterium]|nr:MAG: aspartate aminotransferase [Gammaproteobacteria bacterium]